MPKPIDKQYSFGQLNDPNGPEVFPAYDSSRTNPLARLRRDVIGRDDNLIDFAERKRYRAQVLRVDTLENDDRTNIGFFNQRALVNANIGEKAKDGATFGVYARVDLFDSMPFPQTFDKSNVEAQMLIEQHTFFTAKNAHAQPPAPGDIVWVDWIAKSGTYDQWREPIYIGRLDEDTGAGTSALGNAANSAARAFRNPAEPGSAGGGSSSSTEKYKGGSGAVVPVKLIDNSKFTIHGIDTSGHQWNKHLKHEVLAKEQKFHIVKISYGRTGGQGTKPKNIIADRLEQIRASGTLAGVYHFLRPEWVEILDDGTKPSPERWGELEANNFLKRYNKVKKPGDLPPMLDFEKGHKRDTGAKGHNINILAAIGWAKKVKKELGLTKKLLLYTTLPSWSHYGTKADRELIKQLPEYFDLVWADYVREKGLAKDKRGISNNTALLPSFDFKDLYHAVNIGLPWNEPVIWQWTGYGYLPGHRSQHRLHKIDRNLMRKDYYQRVSLTR